MKQLSYEERLKKIGLFLEKGQLKPYGAGICKPVSSREKKRIIICYLFHAGDEQQVKTTSGKFKPTSKKRRDFFAWGGHKLWNSLPLGAVSAVFTPEVVQNDEENPQRNVKRRTSLSSQEVSYP